MTKRQKNNWYKIFDSFRKSRTKYWAPKVYKALITIIRNTTKEDSVQSAINNLDVNIKIDQLAALIQRMYADAGRVMGGKVYQMVKKQATKAMMPIGKNEELVNEIIQYFQLHLLNKAVLPITDTMKAWILEKLIEAQKEGKGIQQVADELIKHQFPKTRAITISRTETMKAANAGAIIGAKKSGYKMNKIWIAARDIRTRRIPKDAYSHLAMDGITIPIDELFMVPRREGGYDDMTQPLAPDGEAGDVVNCRCSVGFEIVRDENGFPMRA